MAGTLRNYLMKKTAPKPKVAAKPKAPAGPAYYNQAGKLDPNGDYDDKGFMVRVPGKRPSFTKPVAPPSDTEAAKKAGYKR